MIAYALFYADPRAEQARLPLHTFLVSLALWEAGCALEEEELQDAAVKTLPLGATVSVTDIDAAIELNLKMKLLERDPDGRIRLSRLRKTQLDDACRRLDANRKAFHDHMLAAVEKRGVELVEAERESLCAALEDRLVKILQVHSSHVAAAWSTGGEGFDTRLPDLNAREHLREIVNTLAPGASGMSKLRRTAIAVGLDKGLRELPAAGAAYLAAHYHRTVALALLRQDPTLRQTMAELAARRIAYLDANVVLAAMFTADPRHELAVQALELTRGLKAELRVTRFTMDELSHHIRQAAEFMASYRGEGGLRGVVNDVVVRSYHQATRESPALHWAAFVGNFDPPDAWLAEQEITIDEQRPEAESDRRLADVRAAVARVRPSAAVRVIETDALNMLHVTHRRGELRADEMGNRVWLVTLDGSLARAERSLVEQEVLPSGVSRRAGIWVALLSPCLPPDEQSLSGYVAHLVQTQFSLLAEDPIFVNKEFLMTLTRSRFGISDVLSASPERARQVLIRLQQDSEVTDLLGDPQPDDASWVTQLEAVVGRALREIDESPEQRAAIAEHQEARMLAEQAVVEERRRRIEAIRELAKMRGESDRTRLENEELLRRLERVQASPWWRRLARKR
jgi:hypothetical protein